MRCCVCGVPPTYTEHPIMLGVTTSFLLLATIVESFTSFHPPPHTSSSSSSSSGRSPPRGSISYHHRRTMTSSSSSGSSDGCCDDDHRSGHGPYPELVIFDLDACFWDQEMYALSTIPTASNIMLGDLNGRGTGVIGVMSGTD